MQRPPDPAAIPLPARADLPRHVGIIMDGNGRWARQRHLPRVAGHRAGVRAIRPVMEACHQAGVHILTLYAFSTENWQRPRGEVTALMRLFGETIDREVGELHENGVQIRVIGDRARLSESLQAKVAQAEAITAGDTAAILNVAINYGGRREIVDAIRELACTGTDLAAIDEPAIGDALYTRGLPDPDLIVRTAGELRISNFLLWQAAYAEFMSPNTPGRTSARRRFTRRSPTFRDSRAQVRRHPRRRRARPRTPAPSRTPAGRNEPRPEGGVGGGARRDHRRRTLDRHAGGRHHRRRRSGDRGVGAPRAPRPDGSDATRLADPPTEPLAGHSFRCARVGHGDGLGLRRSGRDRVAPPGSEPAALRGMGARCWRGDVRRPLPRVLGRDLSLARAGPEPSGVSSGRGRPRGRGDRGHGSLLRGQRDRPASVLPLDLSPEVGRGRGRPGRSPRCSWVRSPARG